ncbi:redoxin family protein [Dechloromonas sp. TW-R-39-2]|uniref:peroxiredoxin-like family protein n=1 Tax=Dechloromonas sp. TW-R-39-2 TaxID=2654218 RepID=UPI00193CF189|nr:peroxiredoxin-like family protein [Dechloromonas sp. TW-R-39-2]QRM18722.1 redoxin family protein [Dechloromonas sp. TW-R-39-2]
MLIPRHPVPALQLDTLAHGHFDLAKESAANFTLIVFYRGLHCPLCAKYLIELERLVPEFEAQGVSVIALSSDNAERAAAMADKIKARHLRFAYGLSLEKARSWGLYISSSRGKTSIGLDEPSLFSEPGVFMVRPDGTLYYGNVQTMPFARPNFSDLLGGLAFILANDYPARGEYTGAL